jgi:hypothetical protein
MQKIGKQLKFDQPHVAAQVHFERLNLSLHVSQLRDILKTLDYMTNYKKIDVHNSNRPTAPLTDEIGRRTWMRFAIREIQKELQSKYFTWAQLQERNRKRSGKIRN